MKDITVLLLAIHHHLGVGFMVRRQDPYTETEGEKRTGKILRHRPKPLYYRGPSEKLPIMIRLESHRYLVTIQILFYKFFL